MLISPPFLPIRGNDDEDTYLARAMNGGTVDQGAYPVSYNLAWHGGTHLIAPQEGTQHLPARAIADGTVAYIRQPTTMPSDAAAADAHALGYNGWTDDGCVVIRHDSEIGANAQGQGTQVRFYSIYMHLNTIAGTARLNQPIARKAEIGRAGMFEGEANTLHFEIVCDDDNLERFIGRRSGLLNTGSDGRVDAVFGEMYFQLPSNAQVHATRPAANQPTPAGGTPLGEELFAGVRYSGGGARVTTYRADGSPLGAALQENNAEYDLNANAGTIVEAYRTARAAVIPAHSEVYELLRFGRTLGPDDLNPSDTPHWREIRTPTGQGWVNLNGAEVHKFSDADAPHWAGWSLMDDHQDEDSRCNVDVIRTELDENNDTLVTRQEAVNRLRDPAVQALLKRIICKFPTEWHRGSVTARWSWLTRDTRTNDAGQAGPHRPAYMTQTEFNEFQRYVEALCFWEEANTGLDSNHWHFHPREFIKHFRKCLWLSKDELGKIYRNTSEVIRETYRVALNQVTRKYLYINSPLRLSHFLGQGAIESTSLRSMQEASMIGRLQGNNFYGTAINPTSRASEAQLGHWYGAIPAEDDAWFRSNKYNSRGGLIASSYNWRNGNLGDPDAQKFRGRGFKQLTGLINYSRYWVYRGWLDRSTFDDNWWTDRQYAAHNAAHMTLRPPVVDDPHRAAETPYNCMDTGGWYLGSERPHTLRQIDRDSPSVASTAAERAAEQAISYNVTQAINGGGIQRDDRLRETRAAKEVLL